MVGVVVWVQAGARNAAPTPIASTTEVHPPDALISLLGRYTMGAARLAGATEQAKDLLEPLDGFASDPSDAVRVAIVAAEATGAAHALERLDAIAKRDTLPDALRDDLESLRRVYDGRGAELTPEARAALIERHEWFGRLALTFGAPDSDPERALALRSATRTLSVLLLAVIGAIGFSLVGTALGVVALVKFARRTLRPAYAPPTPGGSVYLEAFGVFLLGFLGVSTLAGVIEKQMGVDATFSLIWILLLCPLYPLLRGAVWSKHRYALGLHAGAPLKGRSHGQDRAVRVFREIGAGALGYLAALPIFMVGVGLTLLTAIIMGIFAKAGGESAPPNAHPIIREIGSGGIGGAVMLLLLASVWAPIVEELMFRGCFYHHLRGRWRPIIAGLVVAFVFAVIHPPGIVAVPALMSLAVVFALIREWRGSIIGCMAAHAMHNGAVMLTLMLALS